MWYCSFRGYYVTKSPPYNMITLESQLSKVQDILLLKQQLADNETTIQQINDWIRISEKFRARLMESNAKLRTVINRLQTE